MSVLTPGTTVATSGAQTDATIKITKLVENIHQMDGKFIKDMYYAKTEEKTVEIVKGTYTGKRYTVMTYSTGFPLPAILVADKPATIKTSQGLEETQVVKSFTDYGESIIYIGNLDLAYKGLPNTGETYLFMTMYNNGYRTGIFLQKTLFTDIEIEVSQGLTKETVVKMPLKYLPDEAATKSDIAKAITTALNTAV